MGSPLEKKVLTMKLKEMEEMEKTTRKVNTRVGSLLVSTAPCWLTYKQNPGHENCYPHGHILPGNWDLQSSWCRWRHRMGSVVKRDKETVLKIPKRAFYPTVCTTALSVSYKL